MTMRHNIIFFVITHLSFFGIHGFVIPQSQHVAYRTRRDSISSNPISVNNASSSSSLNKAQTQTQTQTQPHLLHGTTTTITDTIEQESIAQYDELIEHLAYDELVEHTAYDDRPQDSILYLDTPEEVSTYVNNERFSHVLFDCDGVLYRGTDPIPGAARAIRSLMEGGKRCLFVTNNAGIDRRGLREKLRSVLAIEGGDGGELLLEEEQMVCASYSAGRYLQGVFAGRKGAAGGGDGEDHPCSPNIHVVGTNGLCDELRSMGFTVSGGPSLSSSNEKASMSREELAAYSFVEEEEGGLGGGGGGVVDAVVVGLDTEFNYRKLCIANVLLQRHPNALLVATNEDAYDLVGVDARHLPGNGALVKAIEHASQRKAVNVGKPSKILADLLMEEHGIDPQRALMVGDRLDTDVRFGLDGGMKTALVLTGCTTAAQLKGFPGTEEQPLPHVIFPHMGMMGM